MTGFLRVHDHAVAFVLQPDEFPHRRGNEDGVGDQVSLDLGENLLDRLVIGVPILACGRRTGVPVSGLVSYQKQDPSTLETLDACIGIVGVIPIFGGRRHLLICDLTLVPEVAHRGRSRVGVFDVERLTQFVLLPDMVVVHGRVC